MPRTKFFFLYLLPLIIYASIIFYFSSLSDVGFSIDFDRGGLSLHFLEYVGFGFLVQRFLFNLRLKYNTKTLILFSVVVSMSYGLSDEIHQSLVPYRSPSLIDLSADTFGGFVGILIYQKIRNIKKLVFKK